MYPNLKLQLWKAGIRQNRLASMLGLDESLLSKIVNGFREPSPTVRAKIAGLLHSDEQWLFERSEIQQQPEKSSPPTGGCDLSAAAPAPTDNTSGSDPKRLKEA